jgi:hypothetical protein
LGDSFSAVLTADSDNQLAIRNGLDGQTLNIYKNYTDAANYSRASLHYQGNEFVIETEGLGTGSATNLELKVDQNKIKVHTHNTTFNNPILGDNGATVGESGAAWSNSFFDAVNVGAAPTHIEIIPKRFDIETDLDCTSAGAAETTAFNTNVDLEGDTAWASFRYGHNLRTDIEGDGPSDQVTGFRNSLDLRNQNHIGTYYYGFNNSINSEAACNLAGDKLYGAQFRYQSNASNNMNSGTEIASVNITQVWSTDPTVPFAGPLLAGALFNLGTQKLVDADYHHIYINRPTAPRAGFNGPDSLFGIYIAEQNRAATLENNYSIKTIGDRADIANLETNVFRIYNSFTDFNNFEAFQIQADANSYKISTEALGTGIKRPIEVNGPDCQLTLDGSTTKVKGSSNDIVWFTGSGAPSAKFHGTIEPFVNLSKRNGLPTKRWSQVITGGLTANTKTVTSSSVTVQKTDLFIACDCTSNAIAVELPPADDGGFFVVKKIDSGSNIVTITAANNKLIDGASSYSLSGQYDTVSVTFVNGNYLISSIYAN